MRNLFPILFLGVAAAAAPCQNELHYRFDGNCGLEAIQFGTAPIGPANIVTTAPSPWGPGQFGSGLAASDRSAPNETRVVTGWNPGALTSDFSFSAWIRNHPGNPIPLSFGYLWGAGGTEIRCFTGSAGNLLVSGWGGSTLRTATDLNSALGAGWVHVALTVDQTANVATWWINGVAEPTISLTSAPTYTINEFVINAQSPTGTTSPLDIDDFVFALRVFSPGEVTALFTTSPAGAGPFGASCANGTLSTSSAPVVGSPGFQLSLSDPNGSLGWVLLGSDRCDLGPGVLSLPLDLTTVNPLLAGCIGYVDTDIGTFVGTFTGGNADIALPIPNDPNLSGFTAYAQGFVFDRTARTLRSTNALALGIGF